MNEYTDRTVSSLLGVTEETLSLPSEAVKKSGVARAGGACGARSRSEEEAMC
jgi:hypothetical protein